MPHTPDTSDFRYGKVSIALHWLMLLLIAAAYACIQLRELYPRGSDIREGLKAAHFTIGLTVLALVVIRIIARLRAPNPPSPRSWDGWLASLMHLALYAFMVVMPLLGWLTLSAEGDPIPFYGLNLPPLDSPDKGLADRTKELHETIGEVGYWLIGLHAAAALVHHYILRDGVLRRMTPKRT